MDLSAHTRNHERPRYAIANARDTQSRTLAMHNRVRPFRSSHCCHISVAIYQNIFVHFPLFLPSITLNSSFPLFPIKSTSTPYPDPSIFPIFCMNPTSTQTPTHQYFL